MRWAGLVVGATAAVATATVAVPALAGPLAAVNPSNPGRAKPTIVLEHGAWADGSSWSGVVDRLQHRGYSVVAPPNPLRGLAEDAGYLASVLSTIKGPVIVAGHSYGGAVTSAATVAKALVYVGAFSPTSTLPARAGRLRLCLSGGVTREGVPLRPGSRPAHRRPGPVRQTIDQRAGFPACFASLPVTQGAAAARSGRSSPAR
jgi:pimeloyl-ACP methyl ester carboxylesterase